MRDGLENWAIPKYYDKNANLSKTLAKQLDANVTGKFHCKTYTAAVGGKERNLAKFILPSSDATLQKERKE